MRFIKRYRRVCDCAVRAFLNAQKWQSNSCRIRYESLTKTLGVTRNTGANYPAIWRVCRRLGWRRTYRPSYQTLADILSRGSGALVGGMWNKGNETVGHMIFVYGKTPRGYRATGIGRDRLWISKRELHHKFEIYQLFEVLNE